MSEKEINTINKQPIADIAVRERVNKLEEDFSQHSKDYDKLLNTVSQQSKEKANRIVETASGETIVVTDSAEAKPLGLAIDGKSEQTQLSGKNLIPIIRETQTINGVTFTPNKDGSITVNGTATADAIYTIVKKSEMLTPLPVGEKVVFTGCPSGGSDTTYRLQMWGYNNSNGFAIDRGSGTEFTFSNDSNDYNFGIAVYSGTTVSNLVFKPMLKLASITDSTHEPYCGGIPSPNPSYPQEIRNIGVYDEASGKYAIEVKSVGKNLVKNSLNKKHEFGIDVTVNDDGSWTLNGTSTGNCDLYLAGFWSNKSNVLPVDKGEFISSGTGTTSILHYVLKDQNIVASTSSGLGVRFSTDSGITGILYRIEAGVTLSNYTFYPMVRYANMDDTYEPYKETTATVLLDEPLRKGDKAYWNGEKLIVERNRADYTLNGTETFIHQASWTNESLFIITSELPNFNPMPVLDNKHTIICDSLIVTSTTQLANNKENGIAQGGNQGKQVYISILGNATSEEIKAYLATNPLTFEYTLAEPITEEIDIDLDGLSMFYPTTILSNDCNANMEVEYIADTKAYIDKKFAELATAMV